MRLTLIIILISSCATDPYAPIKNDIREKNVSVDAVLNIATTSYIKGCTEGLREVKKSKGHFNQCKDLSLKHKEEMRELLTAPDKSN